MSSYIHGSAPGAAVGVPGGGRSVLHRYELVGDVLVRRRIAERRTGPDRELRLVDALVDEDASGRFLRVVRGIVLTEAALAGLDRAAAEPWREFPVPAALVRAIGEDLGACPRGRAALRLATLDGVELPPAALSIPAG